MDVVDPPNVSPLGSCPGTNPFATCTHPACTRAHPGTAELDAYIRTRWPYVRPYGTFTCRRNSNNLSELSVHAIGRAIDAGIERIASDADNTRGDAVANWLIANAEWIGIQRVGWDGMWWNGERGFLPMRGDPHTNHLHIELSVDGAARRTRFFTEGPPPETCPVVCYGNAAVASDCSYVDCAARGEVCMSGPVRCERAAPPEPPESVRNPGASRPTLTAVGGRSRFNFVGPTRVFDTRPPNDSSRLVRSDGSSGRLSDTHTGTVRDWPGLPASSSGVWLNLAAVNPATRGFVQAFPEGPTPATSNLNFLAGEVRANTAIVPFGGASGVTFRSIAEVDLIADLFGAFADEGVGMRSAGPIRVEDSRATAGPIPADSAYEVDVRALDDAIGIIATVAVIQRDGLVRGFVQAGPCDEGPSATSNVNYGFSPVTANTLVSRISDGSVCFWSTSPVEIIVDVTGYLVPEGELSYQAVAPARLLDTRDDNSLYNGRLGLGQVVEIPIQSLTGAPEGIRSVAVNLTTTNTDAAGFLTAYPCGFETPLSSSHNYAGGTVVGTLAMSSLGGGNLCVFSHGRTDLIVDLVGVWVPTPGSTPGEGPGPMEPGGEEPSPEPDAGVPDAGSPGMDGGVMDAGEGMDAGMDAGGSDMGIDSGCSVGMSRPAPMAALLALAAMIGWRRKKR